MEEAAALNNAAVTIQQAYRSYILRDYSSLDSAAQRRRTGHSPQPEIDAWMCELNCGFTSQDYKIVQEHEQTCTYNYAAPIIPAVSAGASFLSSAETALVDVAADLGARVESASEMMSRVLTGGGGVADETLEADSGAQEAVPLVWEESSGSSSPTRSPSNETLL